MLELYENIKKYRKKLHMSQTQLAEKTGYTDRSMITKIEKGQVDLPLSKILLFAKVLQTTPSELMGTDGCTDSNQKYIVSTESKEDSKIINAYRNASPETQEAIRLILLPKQKSAPISATTEHSPNLGEIESPEIK